MIITNIIIFIRDWSYETSTLYVPAGNQSTTSMVGLKPKPTGSRGYLLKLNP